MKNLIILCTILLASCTTQKQDQEMLQKHFKTVYCLNNESNRYICIDSVDAVYDVKVLDGGGIESKVKINQ